MALGVLGLGWWAAGTPKTLKDLGEVFPHPCGEFQGLDLKPLEWPLRVSPLNAILQKEIRRPSWGD